nr:hypothetical protein [Enterovibrio paralichthyis]
MKRLVLALLTVSWLAWGSPSHAELVVVVSKDNPISQLSSRQLIDLYMGRYNAYPDGRAASTTDLPEDSPLREAFYKKLVGKSVAQVNAYWARLLFAGKSEPPMTNESSQDVIKYIMNNTNGIGYLNESELVDGLKVVYRFEDTQ